MQHAMVSQNYNVVSNDIDPMAAFSENDNDYPNSRQKSKSRKSRGENSTSQKRNKKMSAGRQYYNGGSSQNAINLKQNHSKRQSMGSVERKEATKGGKVAQGQNPKQAAKQPKQAPSTQGTEMMLDRQQSFNNLKTQVKNNELNQMQLNQRIDIFEEEIIKRVREIQKYSKGLNSVLRKNVMPELVALQE